MAAIEQGPNPNEMFTAVPGWIDQPISGHPAGKNLISVKQFSADDIYDYIHEAKAAEQTVAKYRGVPVAAFACMKIIMEQPSTRTAGSTLTAIQKLGGNGQVISDRNATSEAKGESQEDAWVAFATQADIIGYRSATEAGPYLAAEAIAQSSVLRRLQKIVPIINLGNGKDEHPTQFLGDIMTIYDRFNGELSDKTIAVVGDHERYRAHHSTILGATILGMNVIAVETPEAPVPRDIVEFAGKRLQRTDDLDAAMQAADILSVGRNPDEYTGEDENERLRSQALKESYEGWVIDSERLQQMPPDGIVMHPRPRRDELHPSIDNDPRAADVEQMAKMIPMRMTIIARHLGQSISEYWDLERGVTALVQRRKI
jgi:aspartate carbamoyltransferase catalytic subunit